MRRKIHATQGEQRLIAAIVCLDGKNLRGDFRAVRVEVVAKRRAGVAGAGHDEARDVTQRCEDTQEDSPSSGGLPPASHPPWR